MIIELLEQLLIHWCIIIHLVVDHGRTSLDGALYCNGEWLLAVAVDALDVISCVSGFRPCLFIRRDDRVPVQSSSVGKSWIMTTDKDTLAGTVSSVDVPAEGGAAPAPIAAPPVPAAATQGRDAVLGQDARHPVHCRGATPVSLATQQFYDVQQNIRGQN